MTRFGVSILVLCLAFVGAVSRSFAQGAQAAGSASFNVRQGAVAELKEAQQELDSLAQAMPAERSPASNSKASKNPQPTKNRLSIC